MFRVGQKVVCVDAGPQPHQSVDAQWIGESPVVGCIYTVIGTGVSPISGMPCLYLAEIKSTGRFSRYTGYLASRFRPVVDLGWAHEIVARVLKRDKVRA